MKAPDKIYIQQDMINNIPLEEKEFNDDVEYIRKNTLLEWLNNEVELYNDELIQPLSNKEKAIQIASSISSLLVVIAKLETL